jgi:hypothetical protein
MAKTWEERRPGYHSYFEVGDRARIYGDVRAVNIDFEAPVKYSAQVYDPMPEGTKLGIFDLLADAKAIVEQECINRSM